ncbi:hypothetical protein GCM10022213_19290 [Parerythrobacter jejuensis]
MRYSKCVELGAKPLFTEANTRTLTAIGKYLPMVGGLISLSHARGEHFALWLAPLPNFHHFSVVSIFPMAWTDQHKPFMKK